MGSDDVLRARLKAKVDWAAEQGCPVTGLDHEQTARFALRRWRSASRRVRDPRNKTARIGDLIRGFVEANGGASAVGRLKRDYEWLSEQLADELD